MAQIKRIGFGQVEPNHLSAQTNGQIYAQLPAAEGLDILENGMFLKYNYPEGVCGLEGDGEWLLVMNEIKLYDERKYGYKNYAMKRTDFMGGEIVPRLLRTELGDIFTTNTFGPNTSDSAAVSGITLEVGDPVTIDETTGYLKAGEGADGVPTFVVAKVYTMPDMQPGVKLQRVK